MGAGLRRVRGALGTGLTWALGWAVAGLVVGLTSILLPGLPWESLFRIFDAPLPALALPGFLGGILFAGVLGAAGRHRRFDQLSLPRFAAWGALGGALLGLVPAALILLGLATPGPAAPGLGVLTLLCIGPAAVLGAASAAGSLALARMGEAPALPEAGDAGRTPGGERTEPPGPG